jgi:hypothetical protein
VLHLPRHGALLRKQINPKFAESGRRWECPPSPVSANSRTISIPDLQVTFPPPTKGEGGKVTFPPSQEGGKVGKVTFPPSQEGGRWKSPPSLVPGCCMWCLGEGSSKPGSGKSCFAPGPLLKATTPQANKQSKKRPNFELHRCVIPC